MRAFHLLQAFTACAAAIAVTGCGGGGGGGDTEVPTSIDPVVWEFEAEQALANVATAGELARWSFDTFDPNTGTSPGAGAAGDASAFFANSVAGIEGGALWTHAGDQVDLPFTGSLGQRFAVQFWFRYEADEVERQFVLADMRGSGSDGLVVTYDRDTNRLGVSTNTDRSPSVRATIPASTWNHLVVSIRNGRARVFLNGNRVANNLTVGSSDAHANTLIVGGAADGTGRWSGAIDDVRIYNRRLTNREARALSVLDVGLVGHWTFDEATGVTASDASGYTNSGTIEGATWYPGVDNSAASFDGIDDRVVIPGSTELPLAGQITVAAWIRVADPLDDRYRRIVSKKFWWADGAGFELEYNAALGYLSLTAGWDNYARAEGIFLDTGWHHVAAVVDGSTGRIFLDGIEVTTDAAIYALNQGDQPVQIGQMGDQSLAEYTTWNGQIDDVRLYNQALTGVEIAALAEAHSATSAATPFQWVRKLYDPASPSDDAIAATLDVESIEMLESNDLGGRIFLHQWSGDTLAGGRAWGGNALIAPANRPMAIHLESFDVLRGTAIPGNYDFERLSAQDTRLRLAYFGGPVSASNGDGFLPGARSTVDQVIVSLPMRWVPPGRSSAWQTGDYNGNPEQAGVWQVPAGMTIHEAQRDDANRLADLGGLLAAAGPAIGTWAFDFRVSDDGHWTLEAGARYGSDDDDDGDDDDDTIGILDQIITSTDGGSPATISLPTVSPLVIGIDAAGGARSGTIAISDMTLGYEYLGPVADD